MKKVLLLLFIFTFIVVMILYKVNILPIVEDDNMYMQRVSESIYQKGDLINPLEKIAQYPELEIYIYIHQDDISELPINFPKCKILYTDDKFLIGRVIDNFNFIYTGSDMASCESVLCVKSNGKIIYKTNVVIKDNIIGLQSTNSGWMESCNPIDLIDAFKAFYPVYKPLVIM